MTITRRAPSRSARSAYRGSYTTSDVVSKRIVALMHEATIAQSVIEIAEGVARQRDSTNVRKIKLRIGEFKGVVGSALEFSFQALNKGTLAANAELEVETVRLRVECRNCAGVEVAMDDFNLLYPGCGELLNITAGREMQVEYVEID